MPKIVISGEAVELPDLTFGVIERVTAEVGSSNPNPISRMAAIVNAAFEAPVIVKDTRCTADEIKDAYKIVAQYAGFQTGEAKSSGEAKPADAQS